MNLDQLKSTASTMVAPGKGILAMDESHPTCNKRFEKLGIPTSEEKRREYRSMLLKEDEMGAYIGGAILFDETIRQTTLDGVPFSERLSAIGIVPGIKVDKGAKALAGFPGEKVTEGLDGLRERLGEYYDLGARFAKWRAVITIGEGIPTEACLMANAHALARYAALCQEANIVPIVEPEVLMDGDHTVERCDEVTRAALKAVFSELAAQRVVLEGMVLKPNMVVSGADCPEQADVHAVAERTVACLLDTVPGNVPGIAFLSGGQSDEEATAHLNAMNALGKALPWALTFSYGRALQQAAMKTWAGRTDNIDRAAQVILHRAKMNGAAATGQYTPEMEQAA
ncbi:MAG: fructose-bisphosphate aldolase class I [Gammaproteobacteria bacterium]|nr:fructose-bisphosphate aldolase class I [Gammaproteobacteria bacterium]